jgi:heme/copper-type cytochrome/quinol oxidase subunit 2
LLQVRDLQRTHRSQSIVIRQTPCIAVSFQKQQNGNFFAAGKVAVAKARLLRYSVVFFTFGFIFSNVSQLLIMFITKASAKARKAPATLPRHTLLLSFVTIYIILAAAAAAALIYVQDKNESSSALMARFLCNVQSRDSAVLPESG